MKKFVPIFGGIVAVIVLGLGLVMFSKKGTNTTPATVLKNISSKEVSLHATKEDCWTTVGTGVYDITSYVPRHPGGVAEITRICGAEGTSLFESQHGLSRDAKSQLSKLQIGTLAN